MRIGLDIDGVMYKWDKTARYMLREVLPNSPYKMGPLKESESQYWNWIKDNVSPEHWRWLWEEAVGLGLYRYGHLYPGTVQAVRELATVGEVVLITHRPKDAIRDTVAWLSLLDLPVAGMSFLTNMEPKSLVLPHCDIYLDDKPENIVDLMENTSGDAVMMHQPWNKDHRHLGGVATWAAFVERVRNLKGVPA